MSYQGTSVLCEIEDVLENSGFSVESSVPRRIPSQSFERIVPGLHL